MVFVIRGAASCQWLGHNAVNIDGIQCLDVIVYVTKLNASPQLPSICTDWIRTFGARDSREAQWPDHGCASYRPAACAADRAFRDDNVRGILEIRGRLPGVF